MVVRRNLSSICLPSQTIAKYSWHRSYFYIRHGTVCLAFSVGRKRPTSKLHSWGQVSKRTISYCSFSTSPIDGTPSTMPIILDAFIPIFMIQITNHFRSSSCRLCNQRRLTLWVPAHYSWRSCKTLSCWVISREWLSHSLWAGSPSPRDVHALTGIVRI